MSVKNCRSAGIMHRCMRVAGVGLPVAALQVCAAPAETRPNVLFILSDDLGWGDPSCYGNNRFKTPAIDRLAKQGTLFTQFYQGGSVCSPSRAALLTGRWPADVRIYGHLAVAKENEARGMPDFLDPRTMTLPKLLRPAGYTTIHVGKWHLGYPERSGYLANWSLYPQTADQLLTEYGFDLARWIDCRNRTVNLWEDRPHSTKVLVDETCSILEELKKGERPFYCQLWLVDPHAALAPSGEQMKPFKKNVPEGFTSPFMVYAATVTEMDMQIGRLLDKLDELGLAQNTLVIFSSDNGPEDIDIKNASWSGIGSAGPLRGRKRSLYDGGTRVPLIVRWPQGGAPAGQVNTQTVVSGADLLPTICELAGAAIPDGEQKLLRGQSVVPAFKGDKTFRRTAPLLWEWHFRITNHLWNRSPVLAVRDGSWKLLLNPDKSRVELYDMATDPEEQDNVAASHADVVTRLSDLALAWHKTLPPVPVEDAAGKRDYPWPHEETVPASVR